MSDDELDVNIPGERRIVNERGRSSSGTDGGDCGAGKRMREGWRRRDEVELGQCRRRREQMA